MTNEYDFNYGSGRPGMNVSPSWSVQPRDRVCRKQFGQGQQGYQDNSPGAFQFRQTMADGQQTFAEMMGGYGQGEDFLPERRLRQIAQTPIQEVIGNSCCLGKERTKGWHPRSWGSVTHA